MLCTLSPELGTGLLLLRLLFLLLWLLLEVDSRFMPAIPNSNELVAEFGLESIALCGSSFQADGISCLCALAAMIAAM